MNFRAVAAFDAINTNLLPSHLYLAPLLEYLGIIIFGLHASMQSAMPGQGPTNNAVRVLKRSARKGSISPSTGASVMSRLSHEERTAAEHREANLYAVRLAKIDQVNPNVRLLQLEPYVSKDREFIKARKSIPQRIVQLRADHSHAVFPWAMARCTYSWHASSRRLYLDFYASRPREKRLSGACYPAFTKSTC